VRFEHAERFDADVGRLSRRERELFRAVVRERFAPAAERAVAEPEATWPRSLRVRRVEAAPGIWEMTWSFAGPDGRATFEWVELEGEPAIRWRRVGTE
jgi:hypothetical protein